MIDTHTHLYMPEYSFEGQPEGVFEGQCDAVDRAVAAGVTMMIMPNVDRASIEPIKRLNALRPNATAMAMGLHPTEVKENWKDELAFIMAELKSAPAVYKAIGEAGIDLYWEKDFEAQQMDAFEQQLIVAEELHLPVIIHCREGLAQTLEVLSGHRSVEAVFHSFGGTPEDVDLIRRTGDYWFGINGIVTFKNSKLRYTLPAIGTERLVTETDSPFLAPTPHRGKRNESSYIPLILDTMADALGKSPAELDAITTANAKRLFNL